MKIIFLFKLKVTKKEMDDLKKSIQVKVGEVDKRTVRLLTHLDVNSDEIDLALVKLEYVSKEFLENSI